MTSLDEINREFERLHQLMRQLDTLLDEARTLRRHVSVATARLALCLRDAEDGIAADRPRTLRRL
jgi:hypothetical protein